MSVSIRQVFNMIMTPVYIDSQQHPSIISHSPSNSHMLPRWNPLASATRVPLGLELCLLDLSSQTHVLPASPPWDLLTCKSTTLYKNTPQNI